MKRHNHLWDWMTGYSNLERAAIKAARGKRRRRNVAEFLYNLETEICQLQDELRDKTYKPGAYHTFFIYEPKLRMISAAPFRDRVVHHALCSVLEWTFEPTFISDSYACRRGKGTHAAVDRFTEFARRNRYVLKCDVRKFFPSVDHEILKETVARKVKDRNALWLVDRIIDGSNPQEPVWDWFPGDDLLTRTERRLGLPIGNQTSQFFANVFLTDAGRVRRGRVAAARRAAAAGQLDRAHPSRRRLPLAKQDVFWHHIHSEGLDVAFLGTRSIVCCVVAPGTTKPGTAARRFATGTTQRTATTMLVFACVCPVSTPRAVTVTALCQSRAIHGSRGRAGV